MLNERVLKIKRILSDNKIQFRCYLDKQVAAEFDETFKGRRAETLTACIQNFLKEYKAGNIQIVTVDVYEETDKAERN